MKALTTNQSLPRVRMFWDWLRGPYRVHGERALVQSGSLPPGAKVRWFQSKKAFVAAIPSGSRLSRLAWWGSAPIWNGFEAKGLSHALLDLEVADDSIYRLEWMESGRVVKSYFETRETLSDAFEPISARETLKRLTRELFYFGQSIGLHGAIALIAVLAGMQWRGFMQIEDLQAIPQEIPVETMQIASENNGFDGVIPGDVGKGVSEDRANKMSARMNKLADQLSHSMGKMAVAQGAKKDSGLLGKWASMFSGRAVVGASNGQPVHSYGNGKAADSAGERTSLFSGASGAMQDKDGELVADVFRGLQEEFRACYETALLTDPSIAVTLDLDVQVQGNGKLGTGRYEPHGVFNEKSIGALERCVQGVLGKVQLPPRIGGAKIRKQFIFKS